MSLYPFLSHRMTLLSEQLHELGALSSRPLSPLGRQCLALRQAALAEELATLNTLAAQETSLATTQNTREAAA